MKGLSVSEVKPTKPLTLSLATSLGRYSSSTVVSTKRTIPCTEGCSCSDSLGSNAARCTVFIFYGNRSGTR